MTTQLSPESRELLVELIEKELNTPSTTFETTYVEELNEYLFTELKL